MHSSRMRTIQSRGGGYLPRGSVCLGGVCLPGGCLPRGVSAKGVYTSPPTVDRILDTRLSKHYLSATSFADSNKQCLLHNVTVNPPSTSTIVVKMVCSGGSKGGHEGRAPPWGSEFFQFMQFSGKFGKIVCWHPPPGELAPPPRGNPGSVTGMCSSSA